MIIRLKKQKFPPSTDLITKYQMLLEQSRQILDNLSINVEKILNAKIYTLPRSYLSPRVHVVNNEVIMLSLNKEFKILDYDKSVDVSKLIWKHSCLRTSFIGSLKNISAIFSLDIMYNNKLNIYAYNLELGVEGFEELAKRAGLNHPLLQQKEEDITSLCY